MKSTMTAAGRPTCVLLAALISIMPFCTTLAETLPTVPDVGFAVIGGVSVTCTKKNKNSHLHCVESPEKENDVAYKNNTTKIVNAENVSHTSVLPKGKHMPVAMAQPSD